jgi:NAD(P)-dependent dehydrogenase (short-subunit alcohol dehydrogenase family)
MVASEIEVAGGRAIANFGNIANEVEAASIIEDALNNFGRIDAVVNNAGILRDRIWHKMSTDDWQNVIDVHLNGSFYVSRAATPYFKEQKSGSFVHMTSTSALVGNLGQANYSAAKLGIVGLSQSISLDMAAFNVRSNCIAPFAWSRLTATIPASNEAERLRIERMKSMSPEKVAPLVAFLASDRSTGVSNQIFGVRRNELFLFNKIRPIRTIHRSGGWTAEAIATEMLPAFQQSFFGLDRSADVFGWDPI